MFLIVVPLLIFMLLIIEITSNPAFRVDSKPWRHFLSLLSSRKSPNKESSRMLFMLSILVVFVFWEGALRALLLQELPWLISFAGIFPFLVLMYRRVEASRQSSRWRFVDFLCLALFLGMTIGPLMMLLMSPWYAYLMRQYLRPFGKTQS